MTTSINLDEVRQRLRKLKKNETSTKYIWRPKEDTSTRARLVPYKYGEGYPFIEAYFHYGIGGKTYVSPLTFGEPDPFVEFSEQLKSTGDREDWLLSRKFDPKMRTYAPIIIRGEENYGVKFWGFGKTVYQDLLNFIADPDWGDITDPTTGRDFEIKYEAARDGRNYPRTTIIMKPNPVPLTEDADLLNRLLDNQPTIEELFEAPSYKELKKVLERWLKSDDSEEEDDDDDLPDANENNGNGETEEVVTKKLAPKTKKSGALDSSELSGMFDEIFNED